MLRCIVLNSLWAREYKSNDILVTSENKFLSLSLSQQHSPRAPRRSRFNYQKIIFPRAPPFLSLSLETPFIFLPLISL